MPVSRFAPPPYQLVIRPRAVAGVLACIIAALAAASVAGQVAKFNLGRDHVLGFVPLFELDGERNVPTWYAASTLLACSALLAVIGLVRRHERDPFARHWLGLSLLFLYVSLDETAVVHEHLNTIVRKAIPVPALLSYAWVVVAVPLVTAIGLAYLRFLAMLPARFRRWFVASAAVYVGGAVGVETLGALQSTAAGAYSLTTALIATVEETMEMAGVAMFLYALLEYIAGTAGTISVRVGRPRPVTPPAAAQSGRFAEPAARSGTTR